MPATYEGQKILFLGSDVYISCWVSALTNDGTQCHVFCVLVHQHEWTKTASAIHGRKANYSSHAKWKEAKWVAGNYCRLGIQHLLQHMISQSVSNGKQCNFLYDTVSATKVCRCNELSCVTKIKIFSSFCCLHLIDLCTTLFPLSFHYPIFLLPFAHKHTNTLLFCPLTPSCLFPLMHIRRNIFHKIVWH